MVPEPCSRRCRLREQGRGRPRGRSCTREARRGYWGRAPRLGPGCKVCPSRRLQWWSGGRGQRGSCRRGRCRRWTVGCESGLCRLHWEWHLARLFSFALCFSGLWDDAFRHSELIGERGSPGKRPPPCGAPQPGAANSALRLGAVVRPEKYRQTEVTFGSQLKQRPFSSRRARDTLESSSCRQKVKKTAVNARA
jgi:hypothetical protein